MRVLAPRMTTTPMLPFERKASPSCMAGATIVNGRISSSAWLISRRNSTTASARRSALRWIKPSYRSLAGALSVLVSTFLTCSNGDIVIDGPSRALGTVLVMRGDGESAHPSNLGGDQKPLLVPPI
jgi:hypothetical protein